MSSSQKKGITPILATLMLVIIVFSATILFWAYITGYFDAISGCIKIVDFNNDLLFLQNCGQSVIRDFDVYINDVLVPVFETNKTIMIGQTKRFTVTFLPREGIQTIRVVSSIAVTSSGWKIPKGWLMELIFTPVAEEDGTPKLEINGSVFLNDKARTPYRNKTVSYNIDGIDIGNVSTDILGNFTMKKDWAFSFLFPNQWWFVARNFTDNFSTTIIQPPGKVLFNQNPVLTQQSYLYFRDHVNLSGYKVVTPVKIGPLNITYNVNYTIRTNSTIIVPPGSRVFFGTTLDNKDNQYIESFLSINTLNYTVDCYSGCKTGNTTFYINSTIDGGIYNDSNLPIEPGFGKYIEIEVNVSHLNATEAGTTFYASNNHFFGRIKIKIANVSNGVDIATYYYPEIKFINLSGNQTFYPRIYMNALLDVLKKKFNASELKGNYTATIYVYPPDAEEKPFVFQSNRFSINDTTNPLCNGKILANQTNKCQFFPIRRTVLWEIPLLEPNKDYTFGFNANTMRNATEWSLRSSQDYLYVINQAGNVTAMLLASTGVTYNGTNSAHMLDMKIPKYTDSYYAYSLSIPRKIGSTVDIETRTYLMNVGNVNIDSVTVYTVRGDLKECMNAMLTNQSNLPCSLPNSPQPNETLQSNALISIGGYNLNMSYNMSSTVISGCYLPEAGKKMGLYPQECENWILCVGSGAFCTFAKCSSGTYCNVTTGGQRVDAGINISSSLVGTTANARISLWNWYINQIPLWNNHQTHVLILTTADPKPYRPGTFTYTFIT